MDGFKNTTKMKYMGAGGMVDGYAMGGYAKGGDAKGGDAKPMMKGGDAKPKMGMGGAMMNGYAKGGDAKVGAKIAKVMGEFKAGKLHSGSKDGAKVSSPKQAMAIALSEADKGKGKMPVKKADGGSVKRPSMGESLESAKRMEKMEEMEAKEMEAKEMREMMLREKGMGAMAERKMRMMREMKKRVPATRREPMLPSAVGDSGTADRMLRMEDAEALAMGVFKKGGLAAMSKKGKC